MEFKNYLENSASEIEKEIQGILGVWGKELIKIDPKLKLLVDAFIKACKGGKRIRGVLIKLGYEIARGKGKGERGKSESKEILKIAAAYEIFHAAILAHDDIIDQSPIRRGQPSLYKGLGGAHHGISQAICLGDCGFFLATKVISEANFDQENKNKALQYFANTMLETAIGEMLDVELPYLNTQRLKKDVLTIMKLKTARYTISAPLQLGVVLADGKEELIKTLGKFGENLGIAFQIQDDILGVFGSEKITGKSVTSDIEEGKNTILIIEALKKATTKQKHILKKYYGKGETDQEALKSIREVFVETKALDYANKEVAKYTTRARNMLTGMTKDPNLSKLLGQMIEYLVHRTK